MKDTSKTIGQYGYYQKGNRYHWQINGEIKTLCAKQFPCKGELYNDKANYWWP